MLPHLRLPHLLVVLVLLGQVTLAQDVPEIEPYLEQGLLADGEQAMKAAVRKDPNDHQSRFSLGVVRFLRAVERLAQTNYKHGLLQHRGMMIPFARLPVPANENPKEIGYEDARRSLERIVSDLAETERTLADVDTGNVKLSLHFGRIRLDLDGDGEATDEESLWRIFRNFNAAVRQTAAEAFRISFDGGDVHWLRGYCHLLMALAKTALAHDWQNLFEHTAHLFYPRVKSPYTFLQQEHENGGGGLDSRSIVDAIAMIHLISLEVKEPEHMRAAHEHLKAMIAHSRASWKLIMAETDDDLEWLPNPEQTGVIPNVRIRAEMIDGWHLFLEEMEAILDGTKLVPFWRGVPGGNLFDLPPIHPELGVNLRKVFTEPQRFDLVLWIQGTAAAPYLEKGERTNPEIWRRLTQIFRGEFFGFAIWFN